MILITKWRLARSIVLWFQEFWMVEKGRQGFLEPISARGSFFTFETEVITFFSGAIGSVPHFCPYISTESTITGKRQEQGRRCWYLYTTSRSVVFQMSEVQYCHLEVARWDGRDTSFMWKPHGSTGRVKEVRLTVQTPWRRQIDISYKRPADCCGWMREARLRSSDERARNQLSKHLLTYQAKIHLIGHISTHQ